MFSPGFCIRLSAAFLVCFLLLQLHLSFYIKDKSGPNLTSAAVKIFEIYSRINHAINKEGYLDKSQSYKIIPLHHMKKSISSFDVTYISQFTWNRLNLLEDLLDAWKGPVSVAVFSEVKYLDEALWSLSVAVYCCRFKELDLSLVLPAQGTYIPRRTYAVEVSKRLNESELCKSGLSTVYNKNIRNYNWSTPYPVNLLRNVARSRAESDYVLVTDIDMMPSQDLRKNFLRYVWSRKVHPKKIAFVVPVFEMSNEIQRPKIKSQLVEESLKGNVRPFYFLPCRKCQLLTNYTKWFSYPNLPGVRTLYKVDWKHPWEPFFISYHDAPNYDERFKQYGYNRVSQICQLHMEGYNFVVLDNAFLIHRGFKTMEFHETKNKEMTLNRQMYENFKLEMVMKHPKTNRTCDGARLCIHGNRNRQCRSFSCRVDDMQTKNSNAVYRQVPQKVDDGVENQPVLPPRTTSVIAPGSAVTEAPSDGYAPYAPVPIAKATGSGHAQVTNPPPYRMPPHPLPPLPGAAISDTPPPVSSLHTHSSKFPIEREVVLRSTDKNNKIPILSEYNKRPKSAVAPEGPTKQIAWTDNTKQFTGPDNSSSSKHSENTYISFQGGSPSAKHRHNVDIEKGGGGKEEKTKITKTYHTIRDMISNRFNKPKDNIEEQKQMNNQTPSNGTYGARGAGGGETVKVYGETSKSYETGDTSDGVVHRVYGSRERLVDGFPTPKPDESFEGVQCQMKSMSIGQQRGTPRDTRVMPPLPVIRATHHPNFSGASEILSPILPGTPISPQQQQRRLAGMQQQQHSGGYEPESPYQLSHQQIQRKMQNQTPAPESHGTFATARAHLVTMVDGSQQRQPVYEPPRHFPNQDPIYATGSYLPPHQRRPPPPNAKPMYRAHPVDLPQPEGQEGSLTANLESNGVYISKTPNPKFTENYAYSQNPIYGSRPPGEPPKQPPPPPKPEKKQESETDDDGGFKAAIRSGNRGYVVEDKPEGRQPEEPEKENQEPMEKEKEEKDQAMESKQERPSSRNEILSVKAENMGSRTDLLRPDNKVSSATSSDYEKATRRSIGQGSSMGDSGRGSAAYSSGRQESGRGSVEYSSGREKPKERLDTSNESSDGVKRDGVYASQKGLSRGNDSSEWVDIVESELRQILDPKMHGLGGFGSGRGSTLSESVSSLTPPLPPLSPAGGSSPTPTPRQMRYKHSSLPYNMKGEYDSKTLTEEKKFATGKTQRSNGSNGRGNWGGRNGKNGDKSRSLGSNSRNSKVPLAMFGMETDLASTTTGPLDSVLDSRLSDHTSDEDLSTTIDATDALAIRRQLQGLENMYSEVLKLLGVKKYGGRYQPTDPRGKRRYGSMSSLPSSVSSRPMRDKRRDERKKVKDIKGINKRFQRLESHVVTLARSVAHLSSEMRTQHLMIQEMENIRSEISNLRTQTSMNARSQSVPRALNSMLVSPAGEGTDPTALTNPARVKKLTKFFGDEPPLLRLFLKKLGYEKYAALFESERIGMVELPYLTEERLQKMGIPMGPRLRILQEAQISFCRDSVYVV